MDYTIGGDEFSNKFLAWLKVYFIPSQDNGFQPRFLKSKFLLYFVVSLLVVKIISISFFINFPKTIFFSDITKSSLVRLINQERLSSGLRLLTENKKLNEAAYLKAKDIIEKDYFAHRSPEGLDPWYWFSKAGYNYKYAGENLAIGFLDSEDVYRAWFESPSHRSNIVNPLYEEVGTSVLTGDFQGNTITLVVQVFGSERKISKEIEKPTQKSVLNEHMETSTENQNPEETLIESSPEESTMGNIEDGPLSASLAPGGEVLSQYQEAPEEALDNNTSNIYYKFLNFVLYDLEKILEYISYPLIILVSTALLLNILIHINIQDKDLILRSIIIIIILLTTAFLNRDMISQIIIREVII